MALMWDVCYRGQLMPGTGTNRMENNMEQMSNDDIMTWCPTCSVYKAARHFSHRQRSGLKYRDRCLACDEHANLMRAKRHAQKMAQG